MKIICDFDIGNTELNALKCLLELGAEIKFYSIRGNGLFHPKVWLFASEKTFDRVIIGSANFTGPALVNNVEASLFIDNNSSDIQISYSFFEYLRNQDNASLIDVDILEALKEKLSRHKKISGNLNSIESTNSPSDEKTIEILLSYIKSWIDIDTLYKEGFISRLWRGWYIIPDHGHINFEQLLWLKKVLMFLKKHQKDGIIDFSLDSQLSCQIEEFMKKNKAYKKSTLKTSYRGLFIRQEKNFLEALGFILPVIDEKRGKLSVHEYSITSFAEKIIEAQNTNDAFQKLYSEQMISFKWSNLSVFKILAKIILSLRYIDFNEFNFFVKHILAENEAEDIIKLITLYRGLKDSDKVLLHKQYRDYIKEKKENDSKSVVMNYEKNCITAMAALGYIEGLNFIENGKASKIGITDEKVLKVLLNAENA